MKKVRNIFILAVLCVVTAANAQQPLSKEEMNESRRMYYYNFGQWSIGLNGGVSAVWGDFASFSKDKMYLGPIGGLQVIYQATPTIGFSFEGMMGKNRASAVEGNADYYLNTNGFYSPVASDPITNEPFLKYNDLYSDISLIQGRLGLDINLNNLFGGNTDNNFRRMTVVFSPSYYLQYYRPTVYKKSDDARYTSRDLFYQNSNGVGGELALRFRANRIIDFQLKGGGVYGFNQKFDGIAGENENNILAYAQAGILFKLNGKYKKENLIRAATPGKVPYTASRVVEKIIRDTVYIEKVVEKAVPATAQPTETVTVYKGESIVLPEVLPIVGFNRGSSELDVAKYKVELDALVALLKASPETKIDIYGWADHTGGDNINERITQNRAETLRDYLIEAGISSDRIINVEGKGKDLSLEGEDAYGVKARRAEVQPK